MRVAIVGSREFPLPQATKEIHELLMEHGYDCTVVTGGARGIDRLAEAIAESTGCYLRVFHADWNGPLGKGAGFARNQQIVDFADEVHAWWDGKSRGTADTISRARKAGKPVTVHTIARSAQRP